MDSPPVSNPDQPESQESLHGTADMQRFATSIARRQRMRTLGILFLLFMGLWLAIMFVGILGFGLVGFGFIATSMGMLAG